MAEIEIEIDGQKLATTSDKTVMQVADAAGIYIPRFCYHKHLSIAANCRMCLVEVEKAPKPMPACATPVMAGMKVLTKSAKTIDAQRAVMEFLLVNHPLDCPICDQGGECELQDLSMGYGASNSCYDESKRAVANKNLGPLIATEMTRCIHCTRCVRFGKEVAGMPELGLIGRGESTEISQYVAEAMHSEISGNIIDLCPVGALTSKPYRFTARAWELNQTPSISPHDCLGSNLNIHHRNGEVMRVVARENNAVNLTWIADRDRFSYTGLQENRLSEPLIKVNGAWQTASWQKALEFAVGKLQKTLSSHGVEQLGVLSHPSTTLEEMYLLQKLARALGTPHIDHRLREIDCSDQAQFAACPGLDLPLAELAECDAIILVGSHLQHEQPLAAVRVRQAALKGATIVVINAEDYQFSFDVKHKYIVSPALFATALTELHQELNTDSVLATSLQDKRKVCILLGAAVQHHADAHSIRAAAQVLQDQLKAHLGVMTDGANSAGGWLAGMVPHRDATGHHLAAPGMSAYEMLASPRHAYLLLEVEPEKDCANPSQAVAALAHAECVIALAQYHNQTLEKHADVILPIANFTETAGTYINVNAVWQNFTGVVPPPGSARPAWKVLRVLGNFLQLNNFDYESIEEVTAEVKAAVEQRKVTAPPKFKAMSAIDPKADIQLYRLGNIPLYAIDALARHAQPLQAAQKIIVGDVNTARLNAKTAARYHLHDNEIVQFSQQNGHAKYTIAIDNRVADNAVCLAGATEVAATLGDLIGPVAVQKL